jgi:hypothetical protein
VKNPPCGLLGILRKASIIIVLEIKEGTKWMAAHFTIYA